jgi:hypothetical protein
MQRHSGRYWPIRAFSDPSVTFALHEMPRSRGEFPVAKIPGLFVAVIVAGEPVSELASGGRHGLFPGTTRVSQEFASGSGWP